MTLRRQKSMPTRLKLNASSRISSPGSQSKRLGGSQQTGL
jgi:hypothetical protein